MDNAPRTGPDAYEIRDVEENLIGEGPNGRVILVKRHYD